jgi:hypothetical protein
MKGGFKIFRRRKNTVFYYNHKINTAPFFCYSCFENIESLQLYFLCEKTLSILKLTG